MTNSEYDKNFFDDNGGIKTGNDFFLALMGHPNVKVINKKFEDTSLDEIIGKSDKNE